MKYGRVGLTLLAAALAAGILPPKALADSNARIVRLSYVDGDTQIDRGDGRGFEHAFLNMPLGPGTQLFTRDDGRAEIEFEDMSTVRLTPGTLVQTQSLDLRTSGAKYTLVDLQEGTAYFNIRKLDDDNDFRIDSGRREFSPTRASRFRLRVDRSQVVLSVFSGEVEVIGQGGSLTVRKNETLTLDSEDPARYFLAKSISGDRYDDWDRERDEYRERYARSATYSGYSSGYSYGVSDLNYWGSYTYIAGYGYMWRPYYYGVNWNPYANGGWYWYPGSGWIWVSAYPWGWMPFHYGSWYYISGHGWCWRPGNHWRHWSPVVAVHNPPPGHFAPTPPPPTGRRDPVLVGHGPATIVPSEDPGRLRGVKNPNIIDKRGGRPVVGGGSGGTGTPVSGGTPTGGGNTGSGSSGFVGSGGSRLPATDSGGSPSGHRREVDLEDAIQNARERRRGGGQAGGVITNSEPAISVSSGAGSGSGVAAGSPASGRERIPEPRRQLPASLTRDEPTPGSSSGSSGNGNYRWVGSSSVGSTAVSPAADATPTVGGGRASEPRREVPREVFTPRYGSAGSGSPSAGSTRSSSGSSAGSSVSSGSSGGSAAPSSAPSGSGGGRSSGVGSGVGSGSSSGGSRPSSGGASPSPSSGSGRNSSSGTSRSSSTTSTPQ